MLKGGYTGKILRINLTTKDYKEEKLSEELARNYIGGAGFGIKILSDEVEATVDPLSSDNKLIFAPGPLTGTSVPSASRMSVTAKSPLTGAVGMCMTGGYFPAEMKFAGYDVLIVEGKAEEPVYIWIKNEKVYFKKANKLIGTNTFDCQQLIKDDLHDQNIRIACIGPAGEKLSRMACIINEKRAAGRKGLGAVMGSKNLKAIAIRGTNELKIAKEKEFKKAKKRMLKCMKDSPLLYPKMSKYGTPMTLDVTWGLGVLPTKNFLATGKWGPIGKLGIEASDKKKIGSSRCYNCPVGCSQIKLARDGEYAGFMSEPEYETLYSFGGMTGVEEQDAIIAADRLCDEYGLDTISVGVSISFAMELYERGIINKQDTDGLELNFGNHEAMIKMIKKIAFREGFGDILADGVKKAAEKIGKNSDKYAMHIKGLEIPGYDPRGLKAQGLGLATSYTGADHNRSYAFQEVFNIPVPYQVDRFALEGKGKLTKWNQDTRSVTCDCATMCSFLLDMAVAEIAIENTRDLVNGASGLVLTEEDLKKVGERLNNVARVFNVLAGFSREDDTFPERIMREPISEGACKGHYVSQDDLDLMLDEYYKARGWQKNGIPTKEKLNELGLNHEIKNLERAGFF